MHLNHFLGWECVANRARTLPYQEHYKMYYEEEHIGKVNKWYRNTFDKYTVSTGSVSKNIRGPIILIQNMHDDSRKNQVSLNYHKANLFTMKHFYESHDEVSNAMINFDEFSGMMREKLVSLYKECLVPKCDCKIESKRVEYEKTFEKRIKNQYELMSTSLERGADGKPLIAGGRLKLDHKKKEFKR